MPAIEVNGASLHYDTYGERADEPPVVLIHGALATGGRDWGSIAPLLGRTRFVIVPDCRGHGRSTDPARLYSFAQLASDMAGLVRALGFERAHLVGHSNGGNVALVVLVEHPDVVASGVLQAANAWVSPDLQGLAPFYDPDVVARDDPSLVDRLIALHGPVQGDESWRCLLRNTIAEIRRAPSYTPADLAAVVRPTLVIEGTLDRTNAPAGHGAWIARHLRDAELWRPEGAGHSVHVEQPLDWVRTVEDFWQRRGSDLSDSIWRLGRHEYGDTRTTVYQLCVSKGRAAAIEGAVLEPRQRSDVLRLVPPHLDVEDRIIVLDSVARPALVARGVVDVCSGPTDDSRVTQALLGEAVTAYDSVDRWTRVRLWSDGYLGWVRSSALHTPQRETVEAYLRAADGLVTADVALTYDLPGGRVVGRVPFGARLPIAGERDAWLCLRLPSDATPWVRSAEIDRSGEPSPLVQALDRFVRFVGVPYLWGGRTPYGFDCSGLTQALAAIIGVPMPRDADQQYETGSAVDDDWSAGDLVFFGEPGSEPGAQIVHVGVLLDQDRFLHAWAATGATTISSLEPASPQYAPTLAGALAGVRRLPLSRVHAGRPQVDASTVAGTKRLEAK